MLRNAPEGGITDPPVSVPSELIEEASRFAFAAGQPISEDMRLEQPKFSQDRRTWHFWWTRYLNGQPFADESQIFLFDDLTGLLEYYLSRVTDSTCTTEVRLDLETAIAKARTHAALLLKLNLAYHGEVESGWRIEAWSGHPPSLAIQYPNFVLSAEINAATPTYPYAKSPEDPLKPMTEKELTKRRDKPRLAYGVSFQFVYIGTAALHTGLPPVEIWVDAETGEILGGL
jgi:hypothetical protein